MSGLELRSNRSQTITWPRVCSEYHRSSEYHQRGNNMKFIRIISPAALFLLLGTGGSVYGQHEEQAKPEKPEAKQPQQRAQQPKPQAQPKQQHAEQTKPQAQPKQQRAEQTKPQVQPKQQHAVQTKPQAQPKQQRAVQTKPQAQP